MNKHQKTVEGFGDEWARFDQSQLAPLELQALFSKYFSIFPWDKLPENPIGFDMGCGSGRWAKLVAARVGELHCIDPSDALSVAKANLSGLKNCKFYLGGVGEPVLPDKSMDFGYSLGVLHHVPDTSDGIKSCVRMLKPGAPLLLYLYYAFDNRPSWFRALWRTTELLRWSVSRMPNSLRYFLSQVIAFLIYYPVARAALLAEYCGVGSANLNLWPLSSYRKLSLYTMRTDALDRFGTQLEQRFSRDEIFTMMSEAGLVDITFSDDTPFWCAVGYRKD